MSMDEPIIIDLKKYGGEGFIEMMEPSLSAQRERDNLIADLVFTTDKDGNLVKKTSTSIDAMYLRTLSYVESAPFAKNDLNAFFAYTDSLDKKKRGNGRKLYDEMMKAVESIDSGEQSPSAGSLGAESGSSA